MPQLTRQQISRVLRELLPQRVWTDEDLLRWLEETQQRNERAKQSHIKRRLNKLNNPSL
jgi:hypothetical protein